MQTLPNGASLVRLTNQRDGIEVFRDQATVLLNAQSQATAIGGYLGSTAPAPLTKAAPATRLGAADAVARVLQDYGFDASVAQQMQRAAPPTPGDTGPYQWWALPAGVSGAEGATLQQPARVKPVWFRLPQGLVSAYYVEVRVREDGEEHAYAYVVAADDGRLLLRHNQTAHQHDYRVWAETSGAYTPLPGPQGRNGTPHPTGTPDGYAPSLTSANLVGLSNAPFSENDPWLPAGATQTQGNNVHAYADLAAPDGLNPGDDGQCGDNLARDFRACVTAPGVFDYTYDAALGAQANQTQAAASVVNLFYTTNWLHDWFYDAGFDEAAGNAQVDNFGRGGLGGDAMRAEALDYSGTNNANMSTPADGAPPRMQMYRFVNRGVYASAPGVTFTYPPASAQFGRLSFDLAANMVVAEPADGCVALTNSASLSGRIALIDRGSCDFSLKALNAQQAGAVGVVIVNNVAGAPTTMASGASAASVTIPAIMVAQADRAALAAGGVVLRMQGSSVERSSALDNGIVAHEWGHYISNRLIGDASGLSTNHARGLGEGWGDFHALLLMIGAGDINLLSNANWKGTYAVAAHALSTDYSLDAANRAYYGLRRYPYSTDMAKNPLTLRHIVDGQALPDTSTAPRNPAAGGLNAEVHNAGEVWASMLWECYASLLNAHPFQEAQDRMKSYLVAGYKLTPVNPTLIEARDALLAAAGASDPADYMRFANAFAKRGAGGAGIGARPLFAHQRGRDARLRSRWLAGNHRYAAFADRHWGAELRRRHRARQRRDRSAHHYAAQPGFPAHRWHGAADTVRKSAQPVVSRWRYGSGACLGRGAFHHGDGARAACRIGLARRGARHCQCGRGSRFAHARSAPAPRRHRPAVHHRRCRGRDQRHGVRQHAPGLRRRLGCTDQRNAALWPLLCRRHARSHRIALDAHAAAAGGRRQLHCVVQAPLPL